MASKPVGATEASLMLTKTGALVFHSHTYDKIFSAGHFLRQKCAGKQKVPQESVRQSSEKTSWVPGTKMVKQIIWDFHSWRHLRNCLLLLQLTFMCSYMDGKKPLILTRTEIYPCIVFTWAWIDILNLTSRLFLPLLSLAATFWSIIYKMMKWSLCICIWKSQFCR